MSENTAPRDRSNSNLVGPIDDLSKNSTPRVRSNSNLVGSIDNLSKIQPHEKEKLQYRAKEIDAFCIIMVRICTY